MAKGFDAGGLGNMGDLMKQAQKMQRDMARIQEELKERVVEGSAGGEMVKVLVNGANEVVSVKISPEVVDAEDLEMLEDLVLAAVNQGMKKSKELAQAEMQKVTGGLGLPGMF
jgi:DNA-binding YbaB/EbfC family protein